MAERKPGDLNDRVDYGHPAPSPNYSIRLGVR